MKSHIISGGEHVDARGKLTFFNEFDLKEVKRFYVIEPHDSNIVRAWQGHKLEQKWFYVLNGSFKIVLVKPDDWENPSDFLSADEYILTSTNLQVLYAPRGFANGFRALEMDSRIMVFSSFTVEESCDDDYRFDKEKWYDWSR